MRKRKCRVCWGKFEWGKVNEYGLCGECDRQRSRVIEEFLVEGPFDRGSRGECVGAGNTVDLARLPFFHG